MVITACPDGSLCCGDEKTAESCCAQKQGFIIHEGEVYKASEGVPTPTPTPTDTDSEPTDAPGFDSNIQDKPNAETEMEGKPASNNTAAIAGGVVGGVGGLALIGVAAWVLMRRKKRGQMTPMTQMSPAMSHTTTQGYYVPHQQHQHLHHEAIEPSRTPLSELDSEMVPQPVYEMGPSK
jgi:hypothetical protein